MNGEKPSWYSSTLSQIALGSIGCYLVGALWVSFKTGDISSLKWAAEIFGASYLTSRGMKGENGTSHEPAPPASTSG